MVIRPFPKLLNRAFLPDVVLYHVQGIFSFEFSEPPFILLPLSLFYPIESLSLFIAESTYSSIDNLLLHSHMQNSQIHEFFKKLCKSTKVS